MGKFVIKIDRRTTPYEDYVRSIPGLSHHRPGGYGSMMSILSVEMAPDRVCDPHYLVDSLNEALLKLGSTWRLKGWEFDQAMEQLSYVEATLGVRARVPSGMPVLCGLTVRCEITTMDHVDIQRFISHMSSHGFEVLRMNKNLIPPPRPVSTFAPWATSTYLPTEIECSVCKKRFMHTELVDTTREAETDGSYGSEFACPCCGAPDCCELEFEKEKDQGP